MNDDEDLWIAVCQSCDWQGYDRDSWRASDKADAHYNTTGHTSDLVSEDR